MKLYYRKFIIWCLLTYQSIFTNIAIALKNIDDNIFKIPPIDVDEHKKKITRKIHRNRLLEKFYAGKKDTKYQKEFYELLKKSDKFMNEANKHKMDVAIDRWKLSIGKGDIDGVVTDHVGFFDPKHKHIDKKLGEVIESEKLNRKTNDDDYELIDIFSNKPIELGLKDILEITEVEGDMSKKFKFPIKIDRDDKKCLNKIEMLTESLHIKKIGFEYRSLEFFIPEKFGLSKYVDDKHNKIFNEIINFNYVYLNNEYGELAGYSDIKYYKYIKHNGFDVLKFYAKEMKIF